MSLNQHKFKSVPGSSELGAGGVMTMRFHCIACDSIIAFPANYTNDKVNQTMAQHPRYMNFVCRPPMVQSQSN